MFIRIFRNFLIFVLKIIYSIILIIVGFITLILFCISWCLGYIFDWGFFDTLNSFLAMILVCVINDLDFREEKDKEEEDHNYPGDCFEKNHRFPTKEEILG